MGDSWEDDDFQVPSIVNLNVGAVKATANWDDEDQLVVQPEIASGPTPAMREAAARKAEQEEAMLQNQLKFALEEAETPEEKRARERQRVEDEAAQLAGDLFSGGGSAATAKSGSTGLGGIPLKTKQDHSNFATLCQKKLKDSTPLNVGAFYKTLSEKVKDNLTSETLDDVIRMLTIVRDEKKKTEAKVSVVKKKSKREMEQLQRERDERFGESYDNDGYADLEDSFM